MTSRERFEAACAFMPSDRPPVDYLAHRDADSRLRRHLGVGSEDGLLDRLGCDMWYVPARDISQNEGFMRIWRGPRLDITDTERTCPLGIRWTRGAYDAKFTVDEALYGPLKGVRSERDILRHRWPRAADLDFSVLAGDCAAHRSRIVVGGLWSGIFGDSYRMTGFQEFLMNMALAPGLVHTLVDRMTDLYLELNDACFTALRGLVDVWFFGNDFGSQQGLLFGEDMYHGFFHDNISRLTALARSHGLRVMMHSCGAVGPLIPSLVEAGVEILDPVQVTAAGMETEELAGRYGGRIVFHGGIDTQRVLPSASPDEVARHARSVMDTLGRRGGYIFAPSQILDMAIPPENIAAMYGVVTSGQSPSSGGGGDDA